MKSKLPQGSILGHHYSYSILCSFCFIPWPKNISSVVDPIGFPGDIKLVFTRTDMKNLFTVVKEPENSQLFISNKLSLSAKKIEE